MNKNSLIKQAGILSAASIIVRIIGLLYRIPFSRIVGDLGNNYYGIAFNIYSVLIILSGFSIPIAVSKLISGELALGRFKNANRIFITTLIFVSIFGAIISTLLYIFTPIILPATSKNATFALRALAPTLFISGFIGTFQGYFQARKTTVPTAIAQVFEQVINALVSVLLAFILTRFAYGNTEEIATLGALGGTLGTLAGAIISVSVLYTIYHACLPRYKREIKRDNTKYIMSYKKALIIVMAMLIPIVLTGIVSNIGSLIAQYVYYGISEFKQIDPMKFNVDYGIYIGKYFPIISVPISLAMAISTAGLPIISQAYSKKNLKLVRNKFDDILNLNLFITLPCTIGIFILSTPIMQVIFPNTPQTGSTLLKLGAISLIFTNTANITSSFLQGIGKQVKVLIVSIISTIIYTISLVIFLFIGFGINSILMSAIIQGILVAIINMILVNIYSKYKLNLKRHILKLIIPNIALAITTFISYKLIYAIIHINIIATFISIILSMLTYLFLSIKLGFIDKKLLASNSLGRKILQIIK